MDKLQEKTILSRSYIALSKPYSAEIIPVNSSV